MSEMDDPEQSGQRSLLRLLSQVDQARHNDVARLEGELQSMSKRVDGLDVKLAKHSDAIRRIEWQARRANWLQWAQGGMVAVLVVLALSLAGCTYVDVQARDVSLLCTPEGV